MGHYDEQRQAQAERLRKEQLDRERLWEVNHQYAVQKHLGKFIPLPSPVDTIDSIVEEIREGMEIIREEIAALRVALENLYEDE